jgi:hypothetical protein
MKAAVLEGRVYPVELASSIIKVTVDERAGDESYFFEDEALGLKSLIPVSFHSDLLSIAK